MIKGRRVGTLTAGLTLVVFGILFLVRLFTDAIQLQTIFAVWPFVLVLLGAELTLSYFINHEEKLRFDVGSIFLATTLSFVSFGMFVFEYVLENIDKIRGW